MQRAAVLPAPTFTGYSSTLLDFVYLPGNRIQQFIGLERLRDKVVHTSCEAAFAIFAKGICRHGNNWRSVTNRITAKPQCRLDTVEDRSISGWPSFANLQIVPKPASHASDNRVAA